MANSDVWHPALDSSFSSNQSLQGKAGDFPWGKSSLLLLGWLQNQGQQWQQSVPCACATARRHMYRVYNALQQECPLPCSLMSVCALCPAVSGVCTRAAQCPQRSSHYRYRTGNTVPYRIMQGSCIHARECHACAKVGKRYRYLFTNNLVSRSADSLVHLCRRRPRSSSPGEVLRPGHALHATQTAPCTAVT